MFAVAPLSPKCFATLFAMAAAGITGVELALGLLFNRQHQIWDYRRLKGNCMGQICPRYFCIWLLLARALLEEP